MNSFVLGLTPSELGTQIEQIVQDPQGIVGDYFSKHGIIKAPHGLITFSDQSKTVTVKNGITVRLNDETDHSIGQDLTYTFQTTNSKSTLLFNGMSFKECDKVFYQIKEPSVDATMTYFGWYNPKTNKWLYKQINQPWVDITPYTPIADVSLTENGISKISYVGYRQLNDETILTPETVAPVALTGNYLDLNGAYYVHNQTIPSENWIINHNFGRNPNVIVVDDVGQVMFCGRSYPNTNTVIIQFNRPYSGKAYLN